MIVAIVVPRISAPAGLAELFLELLDEHSVKYVCHAAGSYRHDNALRAWKDSSVLKP